MTLLKRLALAISGCPSADEEAINWASEARAAIGIIADEIERRGEKGLDLDPIETAEWLRSKAEQNIMEKPSSKYAKLQHMLGDAIGVPPGDPKVDASIEAVAQWFELLLDNMGIQPSSIPALVRWQYWHSKVTELAEEDDD